MWMVGVVIKTMLVAIALVAIVPTTATREDHEQLVGVVVVVKTTMAWVVGMGKVLNHCPWKDGTIVWRNWNPLLLPTLPETIITVWIGPDH